MTYIKKQKIKLFLLALGLLVVLGVILTKQYTKLFMAPQITKDNTGMTANFNNGNKKILQLGKETDWSDRNSLPFLSIYANSIIESQIEIPTIIEKKFPEVYDFIAGYIAVHTGNLDIARSFFNNLQSKTNSKVYGYLGMLELDSYTKNIVSLCKTVSNYKGNVIFAYPSANELLTDYELECLVSSGRYEDVEKILKEYKFNNVNDEYKKSIILIEVYTVKGKYQESKQVLENIKAKYGNTEALTIAEARLIELTDGYEKSTMFLKEKINKNLSFLTYEYAVHLANSDNQKINALRLMVDTSTERLFDIYSKLNLAHYSFDYGFKKPLEDTYQSLLKIDGISEFSSFNLLEAKLALWKKNHPETKNKLKLVETKNPFEKHYLWFSFQYNNLIGQHDEAMLFASRYLLLEPNNQELKKAILENTHSNK